MKKIQFFGADQLSLSIAWSFACLLLSLDLLDGYWSELGLDFEKHDDIRSPIREYVQAEQLLSELGEEEYHFSMESDLINNLFEKITNTYGELPAAKIFRWIEKRYLEAKTAYHWSSEWNYKLIRLEKYPVIAGIGMGKLAALNAVADKISEIDDQTETEIDALEEEPKSEWDARQYAVYRKENPDVSPLDCLSSYFAHWRFIGIWHEVLNLLTPAELEALELWAKAVHVAEKGYGPPDVLTVPPEYRHPE